MTIRKYRMSITSVNINEIKEGKIPKLPAILGVPCCNRLLSGYSSHLGQREQVCHTDTHTHVRGLVRAHSPLLGLFVFWR